MDWVPYPICDTRSGTFPVLLDVCDIGSIWNFDEDGDAHAYFPGLAARGLKPEIMIFRQDYMKLEKLKT